MHNQKQATLFSREKFLVLDEGSIVLAHHLLRGFLGDCVLGSASVLGCRRVVEPSASRKETALLFSFIPFFL
jgi:hypothetical protein